jgi:hypothetical protein
MCIPRFLSIGGDEPDDVLAMQERRPLVAVLPAKSVDDVPIGVLRAADTPKFNTTADGTATAVAVQA